MIARIVVLIFMVAIVISLGSALYTMLANQKPRSTATVKALSLRIGLSLLLFVLLILGFSLGLLNPHAISANF